MLVVAIGYVFSVALNEPITVLIAIAVALFTTIGSYYHSDKIVLASTGAKPADRERFAHYVNSVEGLALAAGIPCPRPYVIDDPALNAFATGRDPEHAVICVTTGLLEKLNRVELEGVIGHEMSHIKNYDIRFMTLVAVLVGSVALMANWFWWRARWGMGGRSRSRSGGQVQAIAFAIGLVLAILAPVATAAVQAMISRQREFLADSNSALLTRYPEGLASALEKISGDSNKLARTTKATSHLFISSPTKRDAVSRKAGLLDTHPPIEERIRRLREM